MPLPNAVVRSENKVNGKESNEMANAHYDYFTPEIQVKRTTKCHLTASFYTTLML